MYNFDVEKPGTIAEAATAMGAEEAQALGGGQTLIPTLKQRLASSVQAGIPVRRDRDARHQQRG